MEDDLLYSKTIDKNTVLCISSIANSTFKDSEINSLGSDRGYFIFEVDETPGIGGINILGKTATIESAYRLAELFGMRALA